MVTRVHCIVALVAVAMVSGCASWPHDLKEAHDVPLRIALTARPDLAPEHLSTLGYGGGFETKTLVFETLVTRDMQGRLAPGLAHHWSVDDGGRRVVFTLRSGQRFHDGSPVDAAAVAAHFRRWVDRPEHAWLRSAAHITGIHAISEQELAIKLDEPWALLPDLVAINPGGVMAPGASVAGADRWIGSGRYEPSVGDDGTLIYRRRDRARGPRLLEIIPYEVGDDVLGRLERDEVDVVVDDWAGGLDRARLADIERGDEFDVRRASGSAVVYVSFRLEDGPTSAVAVRRAIATSLDRTVLLDDVEHGLATACRAWAAPTVVDWPAARSPSGSQGMALPSHSLRLLIDGESPRQVALGGALVPMLASRGIPVDVVTLVGEPLRLATERGNYDLRVEQTWGVPYDPYLSLVARFADEPAAGTAATRRDFGVDARIAELVERLQRTPDEAGRVVLAQRIQELIDEHVLLVPLYAPDRMVVARRGVAPIHLDHDVYRVSWMDEDGGLP